MKNEYCSVKVLDNFCLLAENEKCRQNTQMKLLLFGVLPLLLLTASCKSNNFSDLNPLDAATESASSKDQATVSSEYMDLVNTRRISLGLNPLILHEELSQIAQTHSQNMATGKVSFGHTGFTERCNQARDVMSGGNLCGEIVANGQSSPKEVYEAWMNSSGHRQKIEESRYMYTGLGYFKNSEGKMYWTQIFLEIN